MAENVLSILQDRLRLKTENEKLKEEVQQLQEKVERLEKTIMEMKTNAPVRDVIVEEVMENQRRLPLFSEFSSQNLIPTEREQWSDVHGKPKTKIMHSTLETNKLLPPGWEWVDEWHIDKTEETDEEGWQYAFNWEFKFAKQSNSTTHVRRRRWARTRRTKL